MNKLLSGIALFCIAIIAHGQPAHITCFNGGMITYDGCGYRIDKEKDTMIFTECVGNAIIYMFDPKCVIKWREVHAVKKRK